MSKQKSSKRSIPLEKMPEIALQFGTYRNQHTWDETPYDPPFLRALSKRTRDWSKLPDSYRMEDFYAEEGIDPKQFWSLRQHCPELNAAHGYALGRLASRREIGSMLGKLKEATVFRSLSHYCAIDKQEAQWRAELAAKAKANQEQNETKIVVIERMPSSNMVPEKKS